MILNWYEKIMRPLVQKYNHEKYWKMRRKVIDYKGGLIKKIICIWYLYRIKRMDAFNNMTFATHLGYGAKFEEPPVLPHATGIHISHNASFGIDCTIFHNATIGEGKDGAPQIGNHVLIGPGATLIGHIHIGDFVNIGSNCVVNFDVPDYATVVMDHPRVIIKEG